MVKTTRAQRCALFQVFQRDFPSWQTPFRRMTYAGSFISVSSIQYRRFRKTVQPYFDGSGCIMVPWHGMWLGIEKDGYTHS